MIDDLAASATMDVGIGPRSSGGENGNPLEHAEQQPPPRSRAAAAAPDEQGEDEIGARQAGGKFT